MAFSLPNLPYEPGALVPWLSEESFTYHHGKHHAAYINKLNQAISGNEMEDTPLEGIIRQTRDSDPAVFNNAAQHYNHQLFWPSLSPTEQPIGDRLSELLKRDFGSIEDFKTKYAEQAAGLFGSGWVWLIQNADDRLEIRQYHNAETPGGSEDHGLLPLDIWEHTYYIDHRNDRGGFIDGFWAHVNWPEIESRLT